MASSSSRSILIVGGGIVGLSCAAVLLHGGHRVTLIAAAPASETASGVAAGMIAPALEAMNEPEPKLAFQRLTAAQAAWLALEAAWPQALREDLRAARSRPSVYAGTPEALARLATTGADTTPEGEGRVRVAGDGLVESRATLDALRAHVAAQGGRLLTKTARSVAHDAVTLDDGTRLEADAVVVAAGYGARAFAAEVPSLACLTPVKGQLLEVAGVGGERGVLRGAGGYWARYDGYAKFGATMEAGRDDVEIDAGTVADLKARAARLAPEANLDAAVARAGVRAATPDGWPLIGRDAASGVLIASGMRRNGYVFAPLAARIVLDLIEGRPADATYDPNRFASTLR